jgi:AbiV family abortive infection protein
MKSCPPGWRPFNGTRSGRTLQFEDNPAGRQSEYQSHDRRGLLPIITVGGPLQTDGMEVRKLPDVSAAQVQELLDALLANADALLNSALAVLELGYVPLARSLAILGLEESGKAIAVHERRVEMASAPEGELFRCDRLDELWASHPKKLELVHSFLVQEPYWFGTEPGDPVANATYLGAIQAWSPRHNHLKNWGFYVDLSKTGAVMAPTDVADQESLRSVIAHVHQIGWQLRLGEHIEGTKQDERVAGMPPATEDEVAWMKGSHWAEAPPEVQHVITEFVESMKEGTPGEPLRNAAYRFNPPEADRSPFRNLGKSGYEAETREIMRMKEELDHRDEAGK